jgi:hypothetical protein
MGDTGMTKRVMMHVDIEADAPEQLADALGRVTDAAMNADARVVRVITTGTRYATEVPDAEVGPTGEVDLEREITLLGRASRRLERARTDAVRKGVID